MFKVSTNVFKQLVSKAVKGAGMNPSITSSRLLAIELKNNVLTLVTTDGCAYLEVSCSDIAGGDFYAMVDVDTFAKLINKMTSEELTLAIEDNRLVVTGNGVYDFAMCFEGDELARFKDYHFETGENSYVMNTNVLKTILKTNKATVCTNTEMPELIAYHFGPMGVLTTNRTCASLTKANFTDISFLLPVRTVALMEVLSGTEIKFYVTETNVKIVSDDVTIYSPKKVETERGKKFPVEVLTNMFSNELAEDYVVLNRTSFISALERLLLVSDKYNQNLLELTFTETFLGLRNVRSSNVGSGVETLEYTTNNLKNPMVVKLTGTVLLNDLKAIMDDDIKIHLKGSTAPIVIDNENICLLISPVATPAEEVAETATV